ncbi:MAG: formimidoylglutamate deiminase [Cyclobacteriaceae bacterium]
MKVYRFEGLLQNEGWINPAFVSVNAEGLIQSIGSEAPDNDISWVKGFALPGFQNAHSHAFQYAMAGLGEIHPKDKKADNFWSWRQKMYEVALTIGPDELEAVAAMLYSEMLRHGYTHVAEFHYLHHDKDGKPYSNLAELGERLIAAAQKAGIKITLVPMFYKNGGFKKPPENHQRRFICKTIDEYFQLLEASKNAVSQYSGASLAFGAHSLRAVHGQDLIELIKQGPKDLPFHIHIAEQLKEVEDCIAFSGLRPVEYLFDQVDVDDRFHLVHATHLNDGEVEMIAKSGAHVVLCPTTEGNLGDGIFKFRDYKKLGGKWSIGTDSHIGLNPLEELRMLDYGQRLISHQRDTFVDDSGDSGNFGFKSALLGGRKAMGNHCDKFFEVGQPFDVVVFDAESPLLAASSPENLLSTIVYSGDVGMIKGAIVDGKWVERNTSIHSNFKQAISQLGIRSA